MNRMDLHRLRILVTAADEQTFRRAAVLIGVGQPVFRHRSRRSKMSLASPWSSARARAHVLPKPGGCSWPTLAGSLLMWRVRGTLSCPSHTERLAGCALPSATTPRRRHSHRSQQRFGNSIRRLTWRCSNCLARCSRPPFDTAWRDNWLIAMPQGHRLAVVETVPLGALTGEDFITTNPSFGPGCHSQSEAMFDAAGV